MKNIRKWHRVIGLIISMPMLLTCITGTFLIMRSHLSFIQPSKTNKQSISLFSIAPVSEVLRVAEKKQKGKITSIIFYPKKGYFSVRTDSDYEMRLHGESLKILTEGPKLTGWLIKLHEGSFFSEIVRDYIFLPSAFGLLILIVSGIYIYIEPKYKKYKRNKNKNKKGIS